MILFQALQNSIPTPRSIQSWFSTLKVLPGLSSNALDLLKERSTKANAKGSELNVTLVMDEISIRKGYSWDGAKTWGQVDLGDGILEEDAPLAKEVLVFMVVSVDLSFKLPIGFYFIAKQIERQN